MKGLAGLLLSFIQSKRFWMAVASIVVPIMQERLGMDEATATQIFWTLISLIIADSVRGLVPKPGALRTMMLGN